MAEGATERVVETLVGLVVEGATGLLEVRSGRKRWQFYLEEGGLTCTRSNLKSEQEEALRALGYVE